MQYHDFPKIGAESMLPLFAFTVGVNEWQYHVVRGTEFIYPQINYCTRGSGTFIFDGKSHIIGPDTAFYIPANYPHEYYSNGDIWDTHWVVLSGFAAEETLINMGFDRPVIINIKDIKLIEHYFHKMHEAIAGNKEFGTLRAAGYSYDFLLELYRQYKTGKTYDTVNPIIIKASDYIKENFTSQIKMDDLCKATGISSHYLCRLFRSELNCRPMEYTAVCRTEYAKDLLITTDMTLATIAEKTGFCESSYFCRIFRRYVGMTPTQFRKLKRTE